MDNQEQSNHDADIDLSAQDPVNNHPQNLNLSLSLSIHQSESQNQMTNIFTSAAQTEVNVGVTRSIGQQGMNGVLSGNTSRLIPSKRRYSDHDRRDFLAGESSRIGAQAGRDQQRVASSHANTNNNLIVSSYRNELSNSDNFQGETFDNIRPFSNMLCQNPIGEVQSIESNINLQTTATPPPVILPTTRGLSNIHHTWGLQLPLTNTPPFFFQSHHAPFISSSSGTANGSTSSVQPSEYAPIFTSSIINAYPIGMPVHYETRSGAISPFLNQRNIHENVMHINPRIGTGDQDNDPGVMRSLAAIGTTNQHGSYYNNISPSNAQTRVTGSTQQRLSEIRNHPGAQESLQEPNLSLALAIGYSRTVNEGSSVARDEPQAYNNSVPFLTTSFQVYPDPRSSLSWLRLTADDQVNATIDILEAALQHEHAGHLQYEDVLEFSANLEELIERHAVIQERNDVVNIGLTEEKILKYIKRENFEFVGENIPENKEKCCICQATYANGEEVGKLDCVHRFHIDCIRQWLEIKNICPVCKQTALAIDGNDE